MADEPNRVEFFTPQHRILGTARLGGQRLTDVLNDDLTSSIELIDAQVLRLLTPKKVVATHDSGLIDKHCILFAISGAQSGHAAERRLFKHVDTTEWGVFITVSSFELTGKLHVRGTSDLKTMLLAWTGQFIPLTRARAVFTLYPDMAYTGDVIIVNRSHIEVICTDQPTSW
jgi:hypothetical protein